MSGPGSLAHGLRVGGAFGGKTICTVELKAALPAFVVQAPVKVQWSRARLQDTRLKDWWHAFVSSYILFTNAALPPWIQRFTDFIGGYSDQPHFSREFRRRVGLAPAAFREAFAATG